MRSEQYLRYIKSKGNRKEYNHALSQVARMQEFEAKNGVDIDEIFYNEDKIEEYLRLSGYNEPFFFAINEYMRTLMENPDLTIREDDEYSCPDRFCFTGFYPFRVPRQYSVKARRSSKIKGFRERRGS